MKIVAMAIDRWANRIDFITSPSTIGPASVLLIVLLSPAGATPVICVNEAADEEIRNDGSGETG